MALFDFIFFEVVTSLSSFCVHFCVSVLSENLGGSEKNFLSAALVFQENAKILLSLQMGS